MPLEFRNAFGSNPIASNHVAAIIYFFKQLGIDYNNDFIKALSQKAQSGGNLDVKREFDAVSDISLDVHSGDAKRGKTLYHVEASPTQDSYLIVVKENNTTTSDSNIRYYTFPNNSYGCKESHIVHAYSTEKQDVFGDGRIVLPKDTFAFYDLNNYSYEGSNNLGGPVMVTSESCRSLSYSKEALGSTLKVEKIPNAPYKPDEKDFIKDLFPGFFKDYGSNPLDSLLAFSLDNDLAYNNKLEIPNSSATITRSIKPDLNGFGYNCVAIIPVSTVESYTITVDAPNIKGKDDIPTGTIEIKTNGGVQITINSCQDLLALLETVGGENEAKKVLIDQLNKLGFIDFKVTMADEQNKVTQPLDSFRLM